ncbi:MAG: hypothetical protein QM804_11400 [Propionicimonas sp.]
MPRRRDAGTRPPPGGGHRGLAGARPDRGGTPGRSDAAYADWYPVDFAEAQPLAFDHNEILRDGVERARAKLEYTDIAATFLPRRFTIAYVRGIYEVIWGEPLDPGNFQRKMTEVFDRVENESVRPTSGRGRPASLFTRKQRATRDGFDLTPIEPPFRRKQ